MPLSSTAICGFCQVTIFEAGSTWGYHHPSISSLQESVRNQCIFCLALYRDVGSWAPTFAELELPLHVWSIRRQGGISRESQQYFAISFRPNSAQGVSKGEALPERTYYILEDKGQVPCNPPHVQNF